MDFEFQENLIWDKLENGKNLLELTTYRNVSLWWNVDNRCFVYLSQLLDKKTTRLRESNRKHVLITRLLESGLGIYLVFLSDLTLFLVAKLVSLLFKPIRKSSVSDKKPLIIAASPDSEWKSYRDYDNGIIKKTDTLLDSTMSLLRKKVNFLVISRLTHSKMSLKRSLEKFLLWEYLYRPVDAFWSPKSWLEQKRSFNHFREIWSILAHDNTLKIKCQFKPGLYNSLMDELKYYFYYLIPQTVSYMETCRNLIVKTNPSLFFISNEYCTWERNLIIIPKEYKLPVFTIQHGIIHPTHRGYIYSRRDIDSMGSILSPYCPIPDKIAVYGEKFRDVLISGGFPSRVIEVTGQPRFDMLRRMKSLFKDRNRLRDFLNLPRDKKLVIWTTTTHGLPLDENLKNLEAVYSAVSELPNVELIIKLHPAEDQTASLYRKNNYNFRVFDGSTDTLLLIYASDILLTKDSTTGLEAILLDKPVIVLNLSEKPDIVDYVREGVAVGVYKKENLKAVINSLLQNDSLAPSRPTYIKPLYRDDGKASERAAQIILSMLSQ